MYSKYERQMDKRGYVIRQTVFRGPVYGFPAERVAPYRKVIFNNNTGLPEYEDIPGVDRPNEAMDEEEEEEE